MNRSPSAFLSCPPSPRTASVTSVPAASSGATIPVGWNWTSSMSASRQPARRARYIPSPVFSSRRDDDRRQIRVCPPAASTTASARNTVRSPVSRSKASAPKQTPSETSSWATYWSSITDTPRSATLAASVRRIARPVAGVAGPPPPVGAEEPLVQAAVRGAGEGRAPVGQLQHRRRRLPGQHLDHPGVGQEVALPQGVAEVLLPGVLGVDGAESGVDPAGGQDRVGVVAA